MSGFEVTQESVSLDQFEIVVERISTLSHAISGGTGIVTRVTSLLKKFVLRMLSDLRRFLNYGVTITLSLER